MKPIRVLIVDDSALVRKVLSEELSKFSDIEVVGTAVDPYAARDKIAELKPDVMTLDLEMPRMDGLSFLEKVMTHFPMPVVIVSSVAPKNSQTALKALELGAVEVISKPGSAFSTPDVGGQLVRAIRAAASAQVNNLVRPVGLQKAKADFNLLTHRKVIGIGASTGGTKALEEILAQLPGTTPGILIVQHMPANFIGPFAARLNQISAMEVREARDQEYVVPGVALVAPGNCHMLLKRDGARYCVHLKDGPPVHFQKPAVDVLFQSMAQAASDGAIGVLLTGMGADGASGLLAMRQKGARTVVQDEKSCVVFGMPKEAVNLGAAERVLPLDQIPSAILELAAEAQAEARHPGMA